ncbi:MAG: sigma-70 family RNA polymerase sigma factor [Candidatus Omnitrophica bacterium]|nr:sigma-70 family RNA polymerase sigma factor [Candidatus Omnitrophota bacterium]
MDSHAEDYLLIDRFLAGDEECFGTLVKKYQNYVINIVYSLSSNFQAAPDIAQEVFIKVYKNLLYFKKESAFSTWLYRITINTTYSFIRAKRELFVAVNTSAEPLRITKGSLTELEEKERRQLVQEAIGSLPSKYRTVLVLKDIEGLSYIEIARILKCRLGTVESRLSRAREVLKRALSSIAGKDGEI